MRRRPNNLLPIYKGNSIREGLYHNILKRSTPMSKPPAFITNGGETRPRHHGNSRENQSTIRRNSRTFGNAKSFEDVVTIGTLWRISALILTFLFILFIATCYVKGSGGIMSAYTVIFSFVWLATIEVITTWFASLLQDNSKSSGEDQLWDSIRLKAASKWMKGYIGRVDYELCLFLFLSWLVSGIILKPTTDDGKTIGAIIFSIVLMILCGVLMYTNAVYTAFARRELARRLMWIVLFSGAIVLGDVSITGFNIYLRTTFFFVVYVLSDVESRGVVIPKWNTYHRSRERKAVQSAWILVVTAPYVLWIVVSIVQISYLSWCIHTSSRGRVKKPNIKKPSWWRSALGGFMPSKYNLNGELLREHYDEEEEEEEREDEEKRREEQEEEDIEAAIEVKIPPTPPPLMNDKGGVAIHVTHTKTPPPPTRVANGRGRGDNRRRTPVQFKPPTPSPGRATRTPIKFVLPQSH
jgi:hypothetical protein